MKKTKFKNRLLIEDRPQVLNFESNEEQSPFAKIDRDYLDEVMLELYKHDEDQPVLVAGKWTTRKAIFEKQKKDALLTAIVRRNLAR